MEQTISPPKPDGRSSPIKVVQGGATGLMKKFLKVKNLSPLQLIRTRACNSNSALNTSPRNLTHPSIALTSEHIDTMFTPSTASHASIGKGKAKEILRDVSAINLDGESESRAESLKTTRESVRLSIDTYNSFDLGVTKEPTSAQGVGDDGVSGGAASDGKENINASTGDRSVPIHTAIRSVASAGIEHLQKLFADSEFGPLRDDLQVILESVRLLEQAEGRLVSATNDDLYRYQVEIINLGRQLQNQVALLSEADSKILDLSGALSQAQSKETTIDMWGRRVAELQANKSMADAHIKKAIEMLKGISGDGKNVDISIEAVIEVLKCTLPK